LESIEKDADGRCKVNPLADWTEAQISDYFMRYDLPPHPLAAAGYRSIGCAPCTRPTPSGEDQRDGRWTGRGKTECGIHLRRALPERVPA
jgi:phosphoadenosine phosphosulfate reductase